MSKYKNLDRFLLVDDNKASNFLHQLIIEEMKLDATVDIVRNGVEALEFLTGKGNPLYKNASEKQGIILLDISMPLMNGWEFLEAYDKLTVEQKGKFVIVIVTTSLNRKDKSLADSNPNVHGFVSKPLSLELLRGIVEKHFEIVK